VIVYLTDIKKSMAKFKSKQNNQNQTEKLEQLWATFTYFGTEGPTIS
jgi:hypothetical protein